MDIHLLFRKKTPLTEWGLPWLRGCQEHPHTARRNLTGRAVVSAILLRALLAGLEGRVLDATAGLIDGEPGLTATVQSHSSPGISVPCWWLSRKGVVHLPHGTPDNVTYHLGVLAMGDALLDPPAAGDFWEAYQRLVAAYQEHGLSEVIRTELCLAADELYYWLRFRNAPVVEANCRLTALAVGDNAEGWVRYSLTQSLPVRGLADLARLQAHLAEHQIRSEPAVSSAPSSSAPELPEPLDGFVGWQAQALAESLTAGENVLLAGPTGTGKTLLTQQVVLAGEAELVVVEGKEGLVDLDFFGAILPQADGRRQWVDGPVLRAMRQAQSDPVVLFLDELNRIPRPHLNLLLGLLNAKSRTLALRQGLPVVGPGPFYVVEVPLTSEAVWCPAAHLRLIAAGNFGRAYQVYDLDPAVRRRFDTVLEFNYLTYEQELALLQRETSLRGAVAEALVKVAHETRRLLDNGELPGCVDTASLLNWARKCERTNAATVISVMAQAERTWADLVCGRDHTGRVNPGNLNALADYLVSLGLLVTSQPVQEG